MKSASEPLKQKIYGAISKRAAESLKEEISMLGPVRLRDVEQAQDAIIQVVRRLEEEGEISLDNRRTMSLSKLIVFDRPVERMPRRARAAGLSEAELADVAS